MQPLWSAQTAYSDPLSIIGLCKLCYHSNIGQNAMSGDYRKQLQCHVIMCKLSQCFNYSKQLLHMQRRLLARWKDLCTGVWGRLYERELYGTQHLHLQHRLHPGPQWQVQVTHPYEPCSEHVCWCVCSHNTLLHTQIFWSHLTLHKTNYHEHRRHNFHMQWPHIWSSIGVHETDLNTIHTPFQELNDLILYILWKKCQLNWKHHTSRMQE